MEYLGAIIDARQDCHLATLNGVLHPNLVECDATLEFGSGDDQTDARLRRAEARLTRKVLTRCTGVALENLGYPGFCPDATPDTEYDAFDHNLCLQGASKELTQFFMQVEYPPFDGRGLETQDIFCQDFLGRHSARMARLEIDERGKCLYKQLQRVKDERIDCRADEDPQAPGTLDDQVDNNVVGAHNLILRAIPNHCPAINFDVLGFPHECPAPDLDIEQVFSLSALTECMYEFHHMNTFRFLDLMFPCSSDCGNGVINLHEECDDGDNEWFGGELCRLNCTRVDCGDPNDDGVINATDSLYILRTAVGLESCDFGICDVNSDLRINATDALHHLQFVVGLPVELMCPELSTTCGNGFLEPPLESCDDGDSTYFRGDFCNSTCRLVACGDTDDNGTINVLDAQYALNAAVENVACTDEICDVSGNRDINSTDALRILMRSVGLFVNFNCPNPPETPLNPALEDN